MTTASPQPRRPRRSLEERRRFQLEALSRATTSQTLTNYPQIYAGFTARGIPEAEILPRENVFTFAAWKALGRFVRKGEHGVRITTWVTAAGKPDPVTGERTEGHRFAQSTFVFHISQTEPEAK